MFKVIEHYPAINADNTARNLLVTIKFNKGINPGSVNQSTISLQESDSYTAVPTVLASAYSTINGEGIIDTVTITPKLNLKPNTNYTVYIFNDPSSIISVDNESLKDISYFKFTTGASILDVPINNVQTTLDVSKPPIIQSATFDLVNNLLLLDFDINLGTFAESGLVRVFSTDRNNYVNVNLPLSGYIYNHNLVLNLIPSQTTAISSLPFANSYLSVSVRENLVNDSYSNSYFNISGITDNVIYNGIIDPLSQLPEIINTDASTLEIVSTVPKDKSSNIDTTNYISITFNAKVNTDYQSIYDFIKVTAKDVV